MFFHNLPHNILLGISVLYAYNLSLSPNRLLFLIHKLYNYINRYNQDAYMCDEKTFARNGNEDICKKGRARNYSRAAPRENGHFD